MKSIASGVAVGVTALRESGSRWGNGPLISVLMPSYNHGRFIRAAIESVLAQRGPFKIELVITDDASTDDALAIAREYQFNRPEIVRIVSGSANVGMCENVKRGFRNLRGDYFAICEADDFWLDSGKLARQLEALSKDAIATVCFHPVFYYDGVSYRGPYTIRAWRRRRFSTKAVFERGGGFMSTPSLFGRLTNELRVGVEGADSFPVMDYLIQSGAAAQGALYIPECMAVYRTNNPSSWTGNLSRSPVSVMNFLINYDRMLKILAADNIHASGWIEFHKFEHAAAIARGAMTRGDVSLMMNVLQYIGLTNWTRLSTRMLARAIQFSSIRRCYFFYRDVASRMDALYQRCGRVFVK